MESRSNKISVEEAAIHNSLKMIHHRIVYDKPDPPAVIKSLFGISVKDLIQEIQQNKQGKYTRLFEVIRKEGIS